MQESYVDKILAVSGMAALGSGGGTMIGNQVGDMIAKSKYHKIDPDSISWSDPKFLNIVRNSLYQAKNDVKIAREWYSSCDKSDKRNAKEEYLKAIENYHNIQRDIAEKNSYRWLTDYKNMKIKSFKDKSKNIGKSIGTLAGGVSGGLAFMRK